MKIRNIKEFERDLKKYRKYRHLEEDLKIAIKVINVEPGKRSHSFRIKNLGNTVIPVFKLKKFYSQDFKGRGCRSGFRLIYAFDEENDEIFLIELYHKRKKNNEDKERILKYFSPKE